MPNKTCTYHCGGCGLHFHSLWAFDRHRVGNPSDAEDPRRCAHPWDLLDKKGDQALVPYADHDGECHIGREDQSGVTIWQERQSAADAERLKRLRRPRLSAEGTPTPTPVVSTHE